MKDLTIVNGCGIISYQFIFVNEKTKKIEKTSYSFLSPPPYLPGQPSTKPLERWLPADSGTYSATMIATNENGCKNSIGAAFSSDPFF